MKIFDNLFYETETDTDTGTGTETERRVIRRAFPIQLTVRDDRKVEWTRQY